eukprot:492218_1
MSKNTIYLHIEDVTGKHVNITVDSNHRINSIKTIIQNRTGIPSQFQQLLFNGQNLSDDKSLNDYQIVSFTTLNLFIALNGGALAQWCSCDCGDCCGTRMRKKGPSYPLITNKNPGCCYKLSRPFLCCCYCLWISCCPCFDNDYNYLPHDLLEQSDEYKRMLLNIKWIGNIRLNRITDKDEIYNMLLCVYTATNNTASKIRNKDQLIQILKECNCSFSVSIEEYIGMHTLKLGRRS